MNPAYPTIESLAERTRKRLPKFVYDYLTGGCNAEVNLKKNTREIREVELKPFYMRDYGGVNLKTTLLGKEYDAPFGIAPIGLQGLIWPAATEILAAAARDHNVPFVLSTVATASIETVGEITGGEFWFQLYHPVETRIRDALLDRAAAAGCKTLVILADTPVPGYRPKDIRNGLTIPPRMELRNILQMLRHPTWSLGQLIAGKPEFQTLKPYLPKGAKMKDIAKFSVDTFDGRLSDVKLQSLRDKWDGKIVVKGVVEPEDLEKAVSIGLDGVIVSNHGGRQLDLGRSSIKSLADLVPTFQDKITIMMDGGIRGGPDIAASIASGAKFCFVGRAPMFGVCALGRQGGDQVMTILKRSLQQVMEQIGCETIENLPNHLHVNV